MLSNRNLVKISGLLQRSLSDWNTRERERRPSRDLFIYIIIIYFSYFPVALLLRTILYFILYIYIKQEDHVTWFYVISLPDE